MWSQVQQGSVIYEYTQHLEIPENLPPGVDIPKKKVDMYRLDFDGKESLYVKDLEFEDPNKKQNVFWGGNKKKKEHRIYYDFDKSTALEQVSFFRKEFLVSDTIANLKWKVIPTEQRDILGYTAMRAVLKDTAKVVEAWFTPQIPVSVGPEKYNGLPGLILALTVDESKVVLATSVTTEPESIVLDAPKEGKKMDREAYDTMKKKKTEEMKKMWGGGKRRWKNK